MSTRPVTARPVPRSSIHSAESGFSLVELVVVTVVMLILAGAVVIAFRGARSGATAKDTIGAASAYEQAITRFQADHANTNPTAADMVVAVGPPPVDLGPRDLLGKPYMRSAPGGVQDGRIGVSMSCAAPPAAGAESGFISFCAGTDPVYQLRVSTRPGGGTPWKTCYMGADPAAAPHC